MKYRPIHKYNLAITTKFKTTTNLTHPWSITYYKTLSKTHDKNEDKAHIIPQRR